jgi:DNA topoisomerase-3
VPGSLAELSRFGKGAAEIYEMVAKSYLCMLAEDFEYDCHEGHVTDYPAFRGSINVPVVAGWRAVDSDAGDDFAGSDRGLGKRAEPFVYEGANKRPQKPTQKWLMAQLGKHDIGTGATRTSTYADVTNTKSRYPLLEDKKGVISFARCGEMGYLMLTGTHIGDLELTRRVQNQMAAIERGEADPDALLREVANLVAEDIPVMVANGKTMRDRLGIVNVAERERVTGRWGDRDVTFRRVWGGHRFTDLEVGKLLAGGDITFECETADGSRYSVTGHLADLTYNGRKYVGFEKVVGDDRVRGKWKGKEVTFKRIWGGHRFTDEEVADLLAGKEIMLEGLKSSSGREYSVKGKLARQTYNGRKYVGFKADFGDR